MKDDRLGFRIAASARAAIATLAPADLSAATRALIVLGAAAVGLDLAAFASEIRSLQGADLDPQIRAQLRALESGAIPMPLVALPSPGLSPSDEEVLVVGDGDGAGFDV